jgi:hypothetical protein
MYANEKPAGEKRLGAACMRCGKWTRRRNRCNHAPGEEHMVCKRCTAPRRNGEHTKCLDCCGWLLKPLQVAQG